MGKRELDKLVFIVTLILIGIGVTMVYNTSYIVSIKKFGDGYFFLKKQLFYGIMGLLAIIIFMRIPYNLYRKIVYPFLFISILLLLMLFIPGLGVKAGGATRWIDAGYITFQPSEVAKLAFIMYLAYFFSAKKDKIKTFKVGFLPPAVIGAILIGLIIMEPDFGGGLFIGSILFLMMFIAGVRIRYLVATLLVSIPLIYLMISKVGYRLNRIMAFRDPWKEAENTGFQIIQSLIAIGSGGIWGKGFGEGRQKLFFLPEAHSDFILAVIGEELGFIGIIVVILLYALLLWAGIRIALDVKELFAIYLAIGITFLITFQAIMNMGVVTGILPPKGLPLPFISYGGTSLMVSATGIGILLNIYYRAERA